MSLLNEGQNSPLSQAVADGKICRNAFLNTSSKLLVLKGAPDAPYDQARVSRRYELTLLNSPQA